MAIEPAKGPEIICQLYVDPSVPAGSAAGQSTQYGSTEPKHNTCGLDELLGCAHAHSGTTSKQAPISSGNKNDFMILGWFNSLRW
jgi:hypothetical protein